MATAAKVPGRYGESPLWRPRLVIPAFVLAAGAGAVLYFFNPTQCHFYPFCLFYRTTGLLCPGCGGLRATHQLLHGHLVAAFHCNAVLVMSLPVVGWLAARLVVNKLKGRPASINVCPTWLWVGFALLLVFTIVRNLPCGRWLAP
jgi:hypothetical protein